MTVKTQMKPQPVESIVAENGQGRTLRVSKTVTQGAKVKLEIISDRDGELEVIRLPVAEFKDLLAELNEHSEYFTRVCS